MAAPRLVLYYGRRSIEVPVNLNVIDLSRPIAQRSVAQKIESCLRELTLPRGLIKPGTRDPKRVPRRKEK
jgi:hypothetical protein